MRIKTIWISVAIAGIALLTGLYFAAPTHGDNNSSASPDAAPTRDLMLMTSLPLIWGEAQNMQEMLAGGGVRHPFYKALMARYNVTPTDSLVEGGSQLAASNPDVLLLAQPRPLTPGELVAVDTWVRSGGRVLILADPMLRMESNYPLGDKRRPQAVSLMAPLFERWGLDFTFDESEGAGLFEMEAGTYKVLAADIGGYALRGVQDTDIADCQVTALTLMARCDIGKGKAILLADADMLDSELMEKSDNGAFLTQLLSEVQMDTATGG